MKRLLKQLVVVFLVTLSLIYGSTVFADGTPSYNENLYTVVVNNPNGAKMYDFDYPEGEEILVEEGILPYGSIFTVDYTSIEAGVTYLVSDDIYYRRVSSADVEIYGEPVSPADLRIKRRL